MTVRDDNLTERVKVVSARESGHVQFKKTG